MSFESVVDAYIESKIMAYMNSDEFGDKVASIIENNFPVVSETVMEERVRSVIENMSFSINIGNVDVEVN